MDDQFVPDDSLPNSMMQDSGIENVSSDCPLNLAILESKRQMKIYEDDLKQLRDPNVLT